MAVKNAMYIFEVVVESVKSFVESRFLVIRAEFADIFSLELKDPKQMYIVIPEPPPLPPEPPGKKGKKKKKPKPKKKGKKGKGAKEPEPPPEPIIQSGQSVLFTSNAEFLIQNMKRFPLEVSLWSKEEALVFIGSSIVPWDPLFVVYLQKIANCEEPKAVTVRDEYNVFQEGTAKLMAKIGLQVKLSYLTDRVLSSFRTLTEDAAIKKVLYTGMNSKTTSYICNYKTTDEDFEQNCNKIENKFITDKQVPEPKPIKYADYTNAPAANLTDFRDENYCCIGEADKPPESKYKAAETCPDIDFIVDYVRKIILSCNDNMRMLTPRPTITPRIKATDIDRLCYCRETRWPEGDLADRFRLETQGGPCPLCINSKRPSGPAREKTLDIANIRGPCGRPDCRIAREMRDYLQNILDEDNVEFDIDDVIGPCGSKACTLAQKIQQCLRREGVFKEGATLEGLSTQCACIQKMQEALMKKDSCATICSKDCEDTSDSEKVCEGPGCPFARSLTEQKVYNVYYFFVEYDKDTNPSSPTNKSSHESCPTDSSPDYMVKFKNCPPTCPSAQGLVPPTCSTNVCSGVSIKKGTSEPLKCINPVCPSKESAEGVSPADSNIVINFDDIHNPCCVETCDMANKVKRFISDGVMKQREKKPPLDPEDPCYCDCECTFKFSSKTTYCPICGGYECLGDDVKEQPEYAKPHPCPLYHKLYDKKLIQVKSPWPEEQQDQTQAQQAADAQSMKSTKTVASRGALSTTGAKAAGSIRGLHDKKQDKKGPTETVKKRKKKAKTSSGGDAEGSKSQAQDKKADTKNWQVTPVPKTMGWLWTAEDIPGLKFRPKWRPGCCHKLLVRKYRTVREGVDNIAKKKRAAMQRKKKIEMKPTLVVKKTEGEYTVQMEVFRKYSKERFLYQYPYDEKPPLIYTIGKTEEEKMKIQKQRERRERRETRRKNRLLQSTFRDKCQEICLKAYNQAIGLIPLPNPNDPECPCQVEALKAPSPVIDSCSCSESVSVSSSDTDLDDWIIEFTPPLARWNPKAKHPPTYADNESQYTYTDYKVKLVDKLGNPVPRFFKGPDGKEECSDLGGFWGPGHQWLEINKDGYVGPDGRWVPMSFIGPDGMFYSAEDGFFTDNLGVSYKIGIDGYIEDGKWVWYKKKGEKGKSISTVSTVETKKTSKKTDAGKTESTKCKTDTKGKETTTTAAQSPVSASGGVATSTGTGKEKGSDKKSASPEKGGDKGADKSIGKGTDKAKAIAGVGPKMKNPIVMNLSVNYKARNKTAGHRERMLSMDSRKLAKYREIMQGLKVYDDMCPFKPPLKANRASNTPRKKVSPFTMDGCCVHAGGRSGPEKSSTGCGVSTTSCCSPGSPVIIC